MAKLILEATGEELVIGQTYKTFRGEDVVLDSIEAPKHSGSTGRVYVKQKGVTSAQGYYPGVINAKWID